MRRVHGMELARLGARPPRSLKSSTGRLTPLSLIPLSRPGLSSREAQCLAAPPPTSRSSSRATRQKGQRRSGGPTSSLNDHATYSITSRSANRRALTSARWGLMSTRPTSLGGAESVAVLGKGEGSAPSGESTGLTPQYGGHLHVAPITTTTSGLDAAGR